MENKEMSKSHKKEISEKIVELMEKDKFYCVAYGIDDDEDAVCGLMTGTNFTIVEIYGLLQKSIIDVEKRTVDSNSDDEMNNIKNLMQTLDKLHKKNQDKD